ncbi:senecionine N-oxygenase-like [Aricia agestis]|uniref:senecionine N-oxygenase-like n=1 Tax=Aricia agestis TaxID=91739 RepID=UPI001C205091|nr:senecionine N-oxygenase-like [Aricia agestis]
MVSANDSKKSDPHVCIIGAGLAGLTSARYLNEEGIKFTVLETTRYVGGTWRYDPRVGTDENGMRLHTRMYKYLRTNLPKPTMELRGFKMSDDLPSFPSWKQYYDYIQEYVKHYDLEPHIKFLHNVESISRVESGWRIKYKNVVTHEEFVEDFDYVFIGTGRYTKPKIPNFQGIEKFVGSVVHSHDYKEPSRYQGRRVLVVGAGPSGHDIGIDIAKASSRLIHSHHSDTAFITGDFPEHYVGKPDVREFKDTGVVFDDGSYEEVDDVVLCTGYYLDYPYIDASCGLTITLDSVTPLHKTIVNIHHPSMMFIGVMIAACNVVAIDAQARYATALVKGKFSLPPKEQMLEDWQQKAEDILSRGRPMSDMHVLDDYEDDYYAELTAESGIERVPPVLFKIKLKDASDKRTNLYTYRKYTYTGKTRVCVIGAGLAGLTSAKYLKDEGIDFTVLESSQYVGGTWRYDPRVGTDEYGIPLHTSMYKHLRTNLPKPTMELTGFKIPEDLPSYPTWKQYYKYILDYVKHFKLEPHIKFLHNVVLVSRVEDSWRVEYQNVVTKEMYVEYYDFVFVGTGHTTTPLMPNIPGTAKFNGSVIHSHDYREPDRYEGRRVLIVGGGPSGMDIGIDVAEVCKRLIHSHHSKANFRTKFPPHYLKKPDVKEFNETGVIFVDGTYEEIDDVILCTGYQYYYPFLDKSCGLDIRPRSVTPLYQYMVNVNQPSMVLMSLVVRACVVAAIDAQARYATALAKGNFTLPPKEKMMEEWQKRADIIRSRGRPISDIHFLAEREDEYYEHLSIESGTFRVPPVMAKIRVNDTEAKIENLYTYRNYEYIVLDKENFVRRLTDEKDRYKYKFGP